MNIDQALAQADMGKEEGLRGLYPVAAQVLAKEVRELREQLATARFPVIATPRQIKGDFYDSTSLHVESDK